MEIEIELPEVRDTNVESSFLAAKMQTEGERGEEIKTGMSCNNFLSQNRDLLSSLAFVLFLQTCILCVHYWFIYEKDDITRAYDRVGSLFTAQVLLVRGPQTVPAEAPNIWMRGIITTLVLIGLVTALAPMIDGAGLSGWRKYAQEVRNIDFAMTGIITAVCYSRWHCPSKHTRSCVRCLILMRISSSAHALVHYLFFLPHDNEETIAFLYGFCFTLDELLYCGWIPFMIWMRVRAAQPPAKQGGNQWPMYVASLGCCMMIVDVQIYKTTWRYINAPTWQVYLQCSSVVCLCIFFISSVATLQQNLLMMPARTPIQKGHQDQAIEAMRIEIIATIAILLALVARRASFLWVICFAGFKFPAKTLDQERRAFFGYYLPCCLTDLAIVVCSTPPTEHLTGIGETSSLISLPRFVLLPSPMHSELQTTRSMQQRRFQTI